MGKKSRSKIKKAPVVSSTEPALGDAPIENKRTPCSSCYAPVKDKGETCPGCLCVFCWRCGRKYFDECPNGSHCVDLTRRCTSCTTGRTIKLKFKEEKGVAFDDVDLDEKLDYAISDKIDINLKPMCHCPSCPTKAQCCYLCFKENSRNVLHCHSCGKVACQGCSEESISLLGAISLAADADDQDRLRSMSDNLSGKLGKALSLCRSCNVPFCMECITMECLFRNENGFECQSCYYTRKNCKNPKCLNDLGVPTKRCGDCHVSRYCSVKCQAEAYPLHLNQCRSLMQKREKRQAAIEESRNVLLLLSENFRSSLLVNTNPDLASVMQPMIAEMEEAASKRPYIPLKERKKARFVIDSAGQYRDADCVSSLEYETHMGMLQRYLNGDDLVKERAGTEFE